MTLKHSVPGAAMGNATAVTGAATQRSIIKNRRIVAVTLRPPSIADVLSDMAIRIDTEGIAFAVGVERAISSPQRWKRLPYEQRLGARDGCTRRHGDRRVAHRP